MTRLEDDAKEFGAHIRQGSGWRLGLLVARSVERGTTAHRVMGDVTHEKVSARQFAELGGIGNHHQKVLRYLDTWALAAAADVVPLDPEDDYAPVVGSLPEWNSYYILTSPHVKKDKTKKQGHEDHIQVDSHLAKAALQLERALVVVRDAAQPIANTESLIESVEHVRAGADLLLTALGGGSEIDWDSELAKLNGE